MRDGPVDTLDSFALRAAFSKVVNMKTFRPVSYALGVVAISFASLEAIETMTGAALVPDWSGAALAISVAGAGFAIGACAHRSGCATRYRKATIVCANAKVCSV